MKFAFSTLAVLALSTCLAAQNSNDAAPTAAHKLVFASGAKITVSYKSFTISSGQTLRDLSSGKSRGANFYNNIYIPSMLDGRIALNASATIGSEEIEAGKYRFSFSIDKDAIWNLDIYTDTGKKTIGDKPYAPEKGWWKQETKVASIPLDTEDNGKDRASRLSVQPVAATKGSKSSGNLKINFGPMVAQVDYQLSKPAKAKRAVEASGKKKKSKK